MQLEWGMRIRVGCLQWCQLILRSPASPRSQLPYGGCGAGGIFCWHRAGNRLRSGSLHNACNLAWRIPDVLRFVDGFPAWFQRHGLPARWRFAHLLPVFLFAVIEQVNGAFRHRAVQLHVVGDGGLYVRVCKPCCRRPCPVSVKDDTAYRFADAVD